MASIGREIGYLKVGVVKRVCRKGTPILYIRLLEQIRGDEQHTNKKDRKLEEGLNIKTRLSNIERSLISSSDCWSYFWVDAPQ